MMNDEQRSSDDLLAALGGAGAAGRAGPSGAGPVRDGSRPGDFGGTEPGGTGPGGTGPGGAELRDTGHEGGETPESDDEQGKDDEANSRPRRPLSFVAEMVVLFAIALTIALLIKTFVVQPFFIPSGSMENTLLIGDKVLVNKVVYDLRPIGRGDIVVFDGTGSWNSPTVSTSTNSNPLARAYDDTLGRLITSIKGLFGTAPGQTDYIKRVIGIPGDHVVCCNAKGQITVNGVALDERSYLMPGASPSEGHFSVIVPPGRLWVMGDNRMYSADSRLHDCQYSDPTASVTCVPYDRNGTVPESAVIGRAFMIVWPPSRFKILSVPSTFGQPGLNRAAGSNAAAALDVGGPVRPSAPYLPLAGGFALAIPLTLAGRRLRVRLKARIRPRGRPRFQARRGARWFQRHRPTGRATRRG